MTLVGKVLLRYTWYNMNVREKLKELVGMLNMHKRGKKVKALELLDEFLNERPRLGIADIEIILKGFEAKKGLLLAVGGENHLRKTLKNSAHYALRLLVKLLDAGSSCRMDFLQVIGSVETILLEQMKLDKHFKAAESTKYEGTYVLCMHINQVRPSLPIETYIRRQVYVDRFKEWLRRNSAPTPERLISEPSRWSQVGTEGETVDPLGVKAIMTLPQVISTEQLDINSLYFKPELFMNKVHPNISISDMEKGSKKLKADYEAGEIEFTDIISQNVQLFSECNVLLEELKTHFAKFQLEEGSACAAHQLLLKAEEAESAILKPLVNNRTETDRVKRLLQLSSSYDYLFKLPTVLDTYHTHMEIDKIIELYQKHYYILKNYSYLPVLSKLVLQIEEVIKKTRETILKQLSKEKEPTTKFVDRTISQLEALKPKESPVKTVLATLSSKFAAVVNNTWTQIDQNSEIPWLIGTGSEHLPWRCSLTEVRSTDNTNILLRRVLEKVYVFCEICLHILENYPTKADKRDISGALKQVTKLLIRNVRQTVFGNHEPVLLKNPHFLSPLLHQFCKLLPQSEFPNLYTEFLVRVIKSEMKDLNKSVNELWAEEMWSKDFSNKYGSCLPRVFEVMCMDKLTQLKELTLVENSAVLEEIGHGFGVAVVDFLQVMRKALEQQATHSSTKSQKILMTVSNAKYLYDVVAPSMYRGISHLYPSSFSFEGFVKNCNERIEDYIQGMLEYYIGFKGDKYEELITQNLNYADASIGLETSIFYRIYIEAAEAFTEIRTYVFKLLANLVKVVNDLHNFSPCYADNVLLNLTEELVRIFRRYIHENRRKFDTASIYQLWLEVEFIKLTLSKFEVHSMDKIFIKLVERFNSVTRRPKSEREAPIFSKEADKKRQAFLHSLVTKTSYLFQSLKT